MRTIFRRRYKPRKFYFINYRIEAPSLRVIDEKGKQIGILSRQEALRQSQERESDLVLVAPSANPPVAKIINFKKFLYQEEKKQKEARKGIKKSVVKDIQISLFIAPADFERLVNKTKFFFDEGNQVRLNLTLRGREIAKKDMAFQLINKFFSQLGPINISKQPRLEGRVIRAVVFRKK